MIVSQGLARPVYVTGDLFPGAVGVSLSRRIRRRCSGFVYATLRAHREYYHAFIAKDTEKAPLVQILANDTPVKDPKLYDVIGLASLEPVPTMDDQSWNVLQDYFVKIGLQQQKVDLTKFIDNSYPPKRRRQLTEPLGMPGRFRRATPRGRTV